MSSCGFASDVLRHRVFGAQRPSPLFGDLPHSPPLIGTRAAYLRWKAIISSCSPINILEPTQRISYDARFQADIECLASVAKSFSMKKQRTPRATHAHTNVHARARARLCLGLPFDTQRKVASRGQNTWLQGAWLQRMCRHACTQRH